MRCQLSETTTRTRAAAPIVSTDDAWILSAIEPPVTVADLKEKVVDAHLGTPAALWWSVGDHEVYNFETQVGEIIGEGYDRLDDSTYSYVHSQTPGVLKRIADNTRALIETAGGPLTALSSLCREEGLGFFARHRMNSHYKVDPASPAYGRFRREHPELMIGRPGEAIPEGSLEWGVMTGLDYAFPEVRERAASVIIELFERFDVDGVELDFMRHPTFFRPDEAYANRYLMTDLVSHVHRRMEQVSAARGRPLKLAVRVPPTLSDAARVGLDVAQWISAGLVDIVVAGMGMVPFQMRLEEFVEAAAGTDCLVYGCIEGARPAVDDEVLRALAYRFWTAGADGVYLYNLFTMGPQWNRRMMNELADPSALRRLDKRYEIDDSSRLTPQAQQGVAGIPGVTDDAHHQIMSAFRNAVPAAQLPVRLERTQSGRGPTLLLDIADDLASSEAEGALDGCVLRLLVERLGPCERLDVIVNGRPLSWSSAVVSDEGRSRVQLEPGYWLRFPTQPVTVIQSGTLVAFDLGAPPLARGINEINVQAAGERQPGPNILKGLEVTIRYKKSQ